MTKYKYILITGSSKGIGKAIAKKFLKQNYKVIGISRTHTISDKNYIPYIQDINALNDFSVILQEIISKYKNITTVVSNAGYGIFDNLENISEKDIENYFKVNLISHIVLAKKFVNYFKKKKTGNLFFMGSEAALSGNAKATIYCGVKHGLLGFVSSLKEEFNKSYVRVSIINPGMVRTKFFEDLKFEPEKSNQYAIAPNDIAELIFYLNSANKNINFSNINLTPIKKAIKFKK